MGAGRLLLPILTWVATAVLSCGASLEVKAGKNFLPVHLNAGWIDLAFGFNTHPANPSDLASNHVTFIINDSQGGTLFRASPLSAMGWNHDRFYNPEEQVVRVWAEGGFAIMPSHGGGVGRAL